MGHMELSAEAVPHVMLPDLGRACPALEGLDAGYAPWLQGISHDDVRSFVSTCRSICHLDLSMVMLMRDFCPVAKILAKAPCLESLAIHGLHLNDDALWQLCADGRLQRLRLMDCFGFTSAGLHAALARLPRLSCICIIASSVPGDDEPDEPSSYLSAEALCCLLQAHSENLEAVIAIAAYDDMGRRLISDTLQQTVWGRVSWLMVDKELHLPSLDEPRFPYLQVPPLFAFVRPAAHPQGLQPGRRVRFQAFDQMAPECYVNATGYVQRIHGNGAIVVRDKLGDRISVSGANVLPF